MASTKTKLEKKITEQSRYSIVQPDLLIWPKSITAVAKSQRLDPPTDWNKMFNFSPFRLERRELCRPTTGRGGMMKENRTRSEILETTRRE